MLEEQFGVDFSSAATVTPTDRFFPDPISSTDDDSIGRLVHRVCERMHVSLAVIEVAIFISDRKFEIVNEVGHSIGEAAGTYQERDGRFRIRIERRRAGRATALVATIAHKLADIRLMGEKRLSGKECDNELCTDLTALFHGSGIFRANTPGYWARDGSVWPDTDVPMPKYMSVPM